MSSIIEGYNYDIFISYRQKDNKHDGWVTEFVNNLKGELESTFKEEISVYFDINPHDGLLETHDVDASLKEKLKCLIFIPIISRTYCDPKSFAWEHEFKVFVEQASNDQFGLKVKLPNGNVASRVLPVRIHDLDIADIKECESVLGGVLRGVDFIYKSAGVNRPLRSKEDNPHDNLNHTIYRDQINKVSLAVKDIIESIEVPVDTGQVQDKEIQVSGSLKKKELTIEEQVRKEEIKPELEVRIEKNKTIRQKIIYRRIPVIVIVSIMLILGIIGARLYYNQKKRQYARYELIPQIQKMTEENFTAPSRAFELATEAEKYIPDDSILINLWPKISSTSSLQTQPEGASVFWKDYDQPKDPWKILGITPLRNFRIPLGYKRIKIEKDGYQTVLLTSLGLLGPGPERFMKLDSIGKLPDNMVRIPSRIAQMYINGLETFRGKKLGEFLVDRFEVTNEEYKCFVDSGGYNKKIYWNYPIFLEGKEISWESAMNIFVDKTGKKGPSDWEVGKYPDGQGNHPVNGISWYEASAYAAFKGKKLPTVYHWSIIAETSRSMNIVPLSNFTGNSTVPIGSMEGISTFGIYDLAGNVREWCFNENVVNGESFILGGGWNDPTYSFTDAGTQPSIDRSLSNGFRCIKVLPGDTTFNSFIVPVLRKFRDYQKERPVDDKTFNIFLRQYAYDNFPLNPQIAVIEDQDILKVEKVTIDAGYNNERLDVYLFLPKDAQPPYQPVLFLSGSNVISTPSFTINEMKSMEFIVKSGRVLVFPILKGTFNRRDELKSDNQEETVFYKDHLIMWRRDIGRTIDYLETRSDVLSDRIGYFGWSWGGFLGGIIPSVEKRIKAVVLNVGGMANNKALQEADQINFIPRVTQPVLMLNGKYDMYFPVETSQKPMFNLLGTPEKDKKLLVYDTGHLVPKTDMIKETLTWFDKYLGPIK